MIIVEAKPGVAYTQSQDGNLLSETSFQYLVGMLRPQVAEHRWFHVSVPTPPAGDTQQEEAAAVDIALRGLSDNGLSISREQCKVLHIRELRYDPKSPDEVQKVKVFLVLAGPNLLVSVCDGESQGIAHCQRTVAERGTMTPVDVATEIIRESLRPLRCVRMGFTRFVQSLAGQARRALLDDTQHASLDNIKRASAYAAMRLLDMQSGAVRQLIDLIDHDHLETSHQAARADLVRMGNMLAVEVTAFKKIDALVEDVRSAHRETLSRRLIEETEKNNQLQKEAEQRKQKSDAQWQILGGLSVPIGIALGIIQSFQLSREVGAAVVTLSSLVSLGLVYFRNDWFSWLYTSKPIEWPALTRSDGEALDMPAHGDATPKSE